jgi:hypothetical protein
MTVQYSPAYYSIDTFEGLGGWKWRVVLNGHTTLSIHDDRGAASLEAARRNYQENSGFYRVGQIGMDGIA